MHCKMQGRKDPCMGTCSTIYTYLCETSRKKTSPILLALKQTPVDSILRWKC